MTIAIPQEMQPDETVPGLPLRENWNLVGTAFLLLTLRHGQGDRGTRSNFHSITRLGHPCVPVLRSSSLSFQTCQSLSAGARTAEACCNFRFLNQPFSFLDS